MASSTLLLVRCGALQVIRSCALLLVCGGALLCVICGTVFLVPCSALLLVFYRALLLIAFCGVKDCSALFGAEAVPSAWVRIPVEPTNFFFLFFSLFYFET